MRGTGPTSPDTADLAAYAALIRFNGEPSIADLMSTFERVIAARSASELASLCGEKISLDFT